MALEEQDEVSQVDGTVPSTAQEVMEVLEEIPPGFIKDYDYGLGLAKEYRFIVETVENLSDCTEFIISDARETGIDHISSAFFISWDDFEAARKKLNSITSLARTAARSVKEAQTYNIIAPKLGRPQTPVTAGIHPVRNLITEIAQGKRRLDNDSQKKILAAISENAREIVKANPKKLARLQDDIELATLEGLIERYTEMLDKMIPESFWQAFFSENPFILNLAFGYPVTVVQDKASVGGRKLSEIGDRITDFLAKNTLTNNTAIFEIKTPQTNLLNKSVYRGGIYTPSTDLSGSINQALDQKQKYQEQIAQIKHDSGISDLESFSVSCCLIVGTVPTSRDQRKSFELARGNSKDVEIITFDELLKKLEQLRDFLVSETSDSGERPRPTRTTQPVAAIDDDEIPF